MATTHEAVPLSRALQHTCAQLAAHSPSPKTDAAYLWSHALDRPLTWMLAYPQWPLSPQQYARGMHLVRQRQAGYSVAHLCGTCGFMDLQLRLTTQVLAPRPESELLVEHALRALPKRANILEWGVGSGAIALAIAQARPDCQILGLDHVRTTVQLARTNVLRLRLPNLHCLHGNWNRAWPRRRFDLIIANPPYVAMHDPCLGTPGVRREPRHALVASARGLQHYPRLARMARRHTRRNGQLLLEHGATQAAACRRIVMRSGWGRARTLKDLAGLPRAVSARRRGY